MNNYNYPKDNPFIIFNNPEFLADIKRLLNNIIVSDCCSEEELESMVYYFISPKIIDNRLNHDKTFAIRFYNFVKDLTPDIPSEEEIISKLTALGKDLFNYQLMTVKDKDEIDYLINIGQYDRFSNKPIYL